MEGDRVVEARADLGAPQVRAKGVSMFSRHPDDIVVVHVARRRHRTQRAPKREIQRFKVTRPNAAPEFIKALVIERRMRPSCVGPTGKVAELH